MNTIKDINLNDIKDKDYDFVLLKIHKLGSAAYAVTDFISDMDPLKWKLRDKVLNALSLMLSHNLYQTMFVLNEIMSLIDLALASRSVSVMNFSLLKKGVADLQNELTALTDTQNRQVLTDWQAMPKPEAHSGVGAPKMARNKNIFLIDRKQAIIDFIKQNGGLATINEIIKIIPGVSSKTIQRELVSLIQSGLIQKQGAKRWSRYQLAVIEKG